MKHGLAGAIRSVEARGYPYYHELNKQYPTHWSSFFGMHQRINQFKLDTDFPRNYQGFKDFITYLGDVPVGMIKPTVGRKDHSLGYIRGNFAWQEHSENMAEVGSRIGSANVRKTRSHKRLDVLRNFLKSVTILTEVTDSVVLMLGYSGKNILLRSLRGLNRLLKKIVNII